MNPDVFITIVYVGIAILVALGTLGCVLPQIRREEAQLARRESRPQRG